MGMLTKAKEETQEPEVEELDETEAPEAAPEDPAAHAEPDADEAGAAPSDNDADDEGGEDMPAALQPEYKRCVAALYQVMYQNDQTARNVLDSLDPSDQGKVESVARTSMLLMHQLDEKLNMQGDVIPYMLLTVVDRLVELLERVKKVKFSDEEMMAAAAAAFEGAKNLFPTESTGADTDTGPDSGTVDTGNGAAPGSVPPGAAEAAPAPGAAPEAAPTEEEVA